MIELESVKRMQSLKTAIEGKTGETHNDLTEAVQELVKMAEKAVAGSQSYDTCKLVISGADSAGELYGYCVQCYDGKDIYYETALSNTALESKNFTNVVCGSIVVIFGRITNGGFVYPVSITALSLAQQKGAIFKMPDVVNDSDALIIILGEGGGGGDN